MEKTQNANQALSFTNLDKYLSKAIESSSTVTQAVLTFYPISGYDQMLHPFRSPLHN